MCKNGWEIILSLKEEGSIGWAYEGIENLGQDKKQGNE